MFTTFFSPIYCPILMCTHLCSLESTVDITDCKIFGKKQAFPPPCMFCHKCLISVKSFIDREYNRKVLLIFLFSNPHGHFQTVHYHLKLIFDLISFISFS